MNREIPGYNFDIVAGADYMLDVSRPVGERVTRLEVTGKPVAPTDSFTLALTNYRQTGGGGYAMIVGAPVVYAVDGGRAAAAHGRGAARRRAPSAGLLHAQLAHRAGERRVVAVP